MLWKSWAYFNDSVFESCATISFFKAPNHFLRSFSDPLLEVMFLFFVIFVFQSSLPVRVLKLKVDGGF